MKKFIHVTTADRKFFRDSFGISDVTIWKALNFEEDTEICRKIRKLAYDRGGILMATAPAVETLHDSDGHIIQYFPNGAVLDITKEDSSAVVKYKGEDMKSFKRVTLTRLPDIQNYARAL